VPQRVQHATHEHTLAEGVGKGLYQVPAEPVNLIDAVVGDAELQREKQGGCLEKEVRPPRCLGV